MKISVSVIIPLYKSRPTDNELCAFRQCFKILGKYDIYVVTYQELCLKEYNSVINQEIHCKYFDRKYFESIAGYNELLKEYCFYKTFKKYDYILIYQLDAWVFKDALVEWCTKKYDYIGAPWFTDFGVYDEEHKLWKVGNGGFSLRRVKRFLYVTNPRARFLSSREVFRTFYKGYKDLPSCLLKCLGRKNNVAYFLQKNPIYKAYNEDSYFSIVLSQYELMKMYIPDVEQAAYFSFERSPRYLFNLTSEQLPFGCHAWEKYDADFWKEKICL